MSETLAIPPHEANGFEMVASTTLSALVLGSLLAIGHLSDQTWHQIQDTMQEIADIRERNPYNF